MGPLDGSDGRAPHDGRDGRRPPLRRCEVGGDIAPELPGTVREPGERAAGKQQRERAREDAGDRDCRAECPDQDAEQQPGAPADAQHEERYESGRGSRAEGAGRRWKTPRSRTAGDVGGGQRPRGDGRDVAGAPERRHREQRPDHAPSEGRQVRGIDGATRHSPTYRSRNCRSSAPLSRCSAADSRPIHR